MADCAHVSIRTLFDDVGQPVLWACANPDCSLRFYPACPTCVTVGHRNGHVEEHRHQFKEMDPESILRIKGLDELMCSCGLISVRGLVRPEERAT